MTIKLINPYFFHNVRNYDMVIFSGEEEIARLTNLQFRTDSSGEIMEWVTTYVSNTYPNDQLEDIIIDLPNNI